MIKNQILLILFFLISNNIYSQRAIQPLGVIRMNVTSSNLTSFASVVLNNDATDSFDREFDGQLLPNAVNISTVTNTNDRLSINSIPVPTANKTVGINITSNVAGIYTVTFSDIDLPHNINLYLKNNETNMLYSLYAGFNFQLTLEANSNINRYSLLFIPEMTNILPIKNDLNIRLERNILNISSSKKIDKILLYNLTGVNVYKEDNISNNHEINIINFTNGYYFIYIISESKVEKHLIFLMKQ